MSIEYIQEDLVSVRLSDKRRVTLAWGDAIEVLGRDGNDTRVQIGGADGQAVEGVVRGKLKTQPRSVLKLSMVDVQQGDGLVLETPEGQILLIDGGDNQLFARYLAARYRNTSADHPLDVAAIVVTHGDADHFKGLSIIRDAEKDDRPGKQIFIHPRRVYHNGLVKGPSKLSDEEIFGRAVPADDGLAVVDLHDDLRQVDARKLNNPFKKWKRTLNHWSKRGEVQISRLAYGDRRAFDFLTPEGISVDVLGPIPIRVRDGRKLCDALPLLRTPPKTVTLPYEEVTDRAERAFSASHTINGHSIAFRLTYGNVRFMLTGDLNQESMQRLREKVKRRDLESEIIKAPHHGAGDFDLRALEWMSPIVSLISSGDESTRTEYIHPRATLVGALGRVSRCKTPIVLCTELAAFFAQRGWSVAEDKGKRYFGFERQSFGIIHVRTDGSRVLVFTHSGKEGMKEAYRFTVDAKHAVRFARDVKKR